MLKMVRDEQNAVANETKNSNSSFEGSDVLRALTISAESVYIEFMTTASQS
jgi:hypothetical protein